MPKVKYLKDLCSGRTGNVHDLQDYEANVLIQLGAAEIFDDSEQTEAVRLAAEHAEAARLAAEKEYEQIPPDALLNLNGRPVVDDFCDMAQQLEPLPETEKPAKKGSKASK
ncbi:hypothetical protein M5F00_01320 [Acinetobacter sp. ANC 4945]|uniref:Uncharacterized protein n=1 Tax=Acinetobacter amyesii TaxID=2942470 RepID=A0A1T1H726_9GAMM|nr:hypothetical protein [Acinetobacter amyesii]MCL6246514.1 hypothetical protein [Acinetobacter amyesii]OOV85520.1 hypothetical protein B1202_02440 [Acinetobacter amyesii]